MGNPTLIKNYTAEADVTAYRVVKFGAADGTVTHAVASTDLSVGVAGDLGALAGERVDVVRAGIADVEFGGTVVRGSKLTVDTAGRVIAAAPAAGVNAQVIGVAEESGVLGDIASILIAPGVVQG